MEAVQIIHQQNNKLSLYLDSRVHTQLTLGHVLLTMQPPLVPPPISPSIMNPLFQTEAPPAQAQAASRPTWSTSAATSQKFTASSPLRDPTPTSAPPASTTEREAIASSEAAPALESELLASPTKKSVPSGSTDIAGSAKPAPESGVDGSIERLLSHETTNRPTPSRWTSPQTGALAPTSASNLLWQADKGKVVYHRKSSCDNCHSRKIKVSRVTSTDHIRAFTAYFSLSPQTLTIRAVRSDQARVWSMLPTGCLVQL